MSITVAAVQLSAGTDKAANLTSALGQLDAAAARGAELVVFPEYTMHCDLAATASLYDVAETLDGTFVTRLGERAAELGVTVLAGMTERDESTQQAYNTLVLLGPTGQVLSTYRKVHLFDAFGHVESATIGAGDPAKVLVFDLGGVRFGALTCYDVRFPELARALVDLGTTALVVPAAWAVGPGKEHQWRTLVTARAIESTAYAVGAGQCAPTGVGQTVVVDPAGAVIAGVGDGPGLAIATLDPDRVAAVRTAVPALSHRRFTVSPR